MKKVRYTLILPLAFILLIIGVASYMNHRTIGISAEECKEVGGKVNLEKDLLAINWLFSCEK
ncbi:hypothetical protein [Guptibacillus hwajinpoensis]|uniref:hypothetical protein n=1 Tax=Guptibacillus hwajinpoensis TaxID=208199 RepID=UPI001CFF36B7|nr:hypothetical protein [Pseudalkalibacillus hwajinpoensis]WLR58838.1 hypothetical protein LC071_16970 [Pseudalkalibacillus hwajinpoensis]